MNRPVYLFVLRDRAGGTIMGSAQFPIHGPIRRDDPTVRAVATTAAIGFEMATIAGLLRDQAQQAVGRKLWNHAVAEQMLASAIEGRSIDIPANTTSISPYIETVPDDASYLATLASYVREHRQVFQSPEWGQVT